jgi:hypothetical protein
MAKNGGSAIPRKILLAAAERIRDHANKLAAAVRDSGDVTLVPLDRLPIDAAIKKLSERSRLPKLVFQPQIKGDNLATANLHVCAYFHLEMAFTDAGLIVGGNKAGQTREITHVLAKVESARSAIGKLSPRTLPVHINQLFRENPLRNRRKERIDTLFKLQDPLSSADHYLEDLARYLKADLSELAKLGSGRPPDIQKEAFVLEVGRLWQVLTGRKPSWKLGLPFHDLLNAAWASGFEAPVLEPNFERVLRRLNSRETKPG